MIRTFEGNPKEVPTVAALGTNAVQAKVVAEVKRRLGPQQLDLFAGESDLAAVVLATTRHVVAGIIDIPRIVVVPRAEVASGFRPFALDLAAVRYPVPSEELLAQSLRTGEQDRIAAGRGGVREGRLEDYVVAGLVDFDDVSYDDHSDLLYDLATQAVDHLRGYLKDDRDIAARPSRLPEAHRGTRPRPVGGPRLGRGDGVRRDGDEGIYGRAGKRPTPRTRPRRSSTAASPPPTRGRSRSTFIPASPGACIG